MPPASWIPLIGNLGFPIALAIFLLWWIRWWFKKIQEQAVEREKDLKKDAIERERVLKEDAFEREKLLREEAIEREKRLGERIDKVEDERREELVTLVGDQTQAQTEANTIIKRLCTNIDRLVNHLETRPCLGVDEPGPEGRILEGRLPRAQDTTGQTTAEHAQPPHRRQR